MTEATNNASGAVAMSSGNPRSVEHLSQAVLKEHIHYCPETGVFTRTSGALAGVIAGCRHADGYTAIKVLGLMYFAQRLAFLYMEGRFPKECVDHIDGDRTNNSWSNLRPASRIENARNMRRSVRNKSGVTGVSWRKDQGAWRACIKVNFRTISLPSDGTIFGAACARKSAELAYGFHQNHGRG